MQEAEENFDLALIGALEIDVVPHLGDKRVPDPLVGQLAKVLQQGSRLYEAEVASNPHSPVSSSGSREFEKIEMDGPYENGSTQSGTLLPRERFSYWCFDLLFLICSNITKGRSISYYAALGTHASVDRPRAITTKTGCPESPIITESVPKRHGGIRSR